MRPFLQPLPSRQRQCGLRRQGGAALLMAMIIVTLVATLAVSMVWQQWRAVQVEVAERARTQASWILSGALDWSRLILREDARSRRPTALTEPWAVPLAEARLSTFLAADGANTDDAPEAFLSGSITDAQSRYNLMSLVPQGKIAKEELEAFERLCQAVGVDSGVAARIAAGLHDALASGGGDAPNPAAPLLPATVAQLSWLGIDAATLHLLEPFVVLLPVATPVNVNTAPREVLVAVIKGLDLATAERLLQIRQRTPFRDVPAFAAQIPTLTPLSAQLTTLSNYFEVRGRLRLADRVLEQRSLVRRLPNGQVDVLQRERVASLDQASP